MKHLVSSIVASLIALGIACGSSRPTPARPDPATLATALHADLTQLAEIAKRLQGKCPELIAELRPLVSRMRAHAQEVRTSLENPEAGKRLRAEARKYDVEHRGLADAIGEDLAASYLACNKDQELIRVIDLIPEL